MENALITSNVTNAIAAAGQIANEYAAADAFVDYVSRKSQNTIGAQHADLNTWASYVGKVIRNTECTDGDSLQTTPGAWRGVSWGLVAGFAKWMLAEGYAIGTINRKLSTVKIYCRLAGQAGVISSEEVALIRSVSGYGVKEGKRVDEKRSDGGHRTRKGAKKPRNISIAPEQANLLKNQPDTPQGRRDALLFCLLLDHGLRVGEVAALQVADFNLIEGTFTFYREKVGVTQTHRMTIDTVRAVAVWLHTDAPAIGPLLRGSRKGGQLTTAGMSARAITKRVRVLGKAVGLGGLSAHDCRHYWATRAATAGTDAFALRDAGGWSSLAMPSRYVEAATIANERVKL